MGISGIYTVSLSLQVLEHTLAGALVQIGILFSSVSSEKRSSAAAINEPSTVTVEVFRFFFFTSFGADFAAVADAFEDAVAMGVAAGAGAGVPARLGSALTVRSLP